MEFEWTKSTSQLFIRLPQKEGTLYNEGAWIDRSEIIGWERVKTNNGDTSQAVIYTKTGTSFYVTVDGNKDAIDEIVKALKESNAE